MTYVLRPNGTGTDMVITGRWTSRAADAFANGEADGLVLNYARGFQERNLEFLRNLPVRRLAILARTIFDLEPLYDLGQTLTSLSVETDGRFLLDLGRIPRLRYLSATWPQVRSSITAARELEECFFLTYDDIDLVPLVALSKLKKLRMKDEPELTSLTGLANLPSLIELGIFGGRALSDLTELKSSTAPLLERLEVESCRQVSSFEEISACSALKVLNAADCGDIQSLHPITACVDLEALWLWESTRIVDGDLSPLLRLPKLRDVAMMSRRGYSPSIKEIEATIASRP